MMAMREALGERIELTAEEVAEDTEATACVILCDYVSEEDAGEMSEMLYKHVFMLVHDALMRRFSARHVRFRKDELAREVSEQVAEEMGMIVSIYLSDFTSIDEAIEGGAKIKGDVRIAVHDAIMRNF